MPYTPQKNLNRRQALMSALQNTPMNDTGKRTDVGRGLAHMLRQYQAGQMGRQMDTEQAENEKIRGSERADILRKLANPGATPAPDLASMPISQGMDPAMVAGAQQATVGNPSLEDTQYQSPVAQELQATMIGNQIQRKQEAEQSQFEFDRQATEDERAREFDRETKHQGYQIQGDQTRQTNNAQPFNLGVGSIGFDGEGNVRGQNNNASGSSKGMGSIGSSPVIKNFYENVQKPTEAAGNKVVNINNLRSLNQSGRLMEFEGAFAPLFKGVLSGLESIGFDSDTLADSELFASQVAAIKIEDMRALGARGLTDTDMKIIADAYPQISLSSEARTTILDVLEKSQYKMVDFFKEEQKKMDDMGLGVIAREPGWMQELTQGSAYQSYRQGKSQMGLQAPAPEGVDAVTWSFLTPEEKQEFMNGN